MVLRPFPGDAIRDMLSSEDEILGEESLEESRLLGVTGLKVSIRLSLFSRVFFLKRLRHQPHKLNTVTRETALAKSTITCSASSIPLPEMMRK